MTFILLGLLQAVLLLGAITSLATALNNNK